MVEKRTIRWAGNEGGIKIEISALALALSLSLDISVTRCIKEHMDLSRPKRRASDRSGEIKLDEEEEGLEARDWSSLTEPLVLCILRLLSTLEDFFAFRGVCRSWRSAAVSTAYSMASQFPLILLTRFPGHAEAFYDIARQRLYKAPLPCRLYSRYSIGYSHGHLITTTPNHKLLLWNIFTGAAIRLPRAREPFQRAIFSSSPTSPDCLVLLLYSGSATLQYCRLRDRRWSVSFCPSTPQSYISIKDMIFFNGGLFYLSTAGQLGVMDLFPCPKLTTLEVEIPGFFNEEPHYHDCWLAESDGELLLVCIACKPESNYWSQELAEIHVYRWDFAGGKLEKISDLGGRTLFMGIDGFAASLSFNGLGIRENCIYYISSSVNRWIVFSLENKSIEYVSPIMCGLLRGHIREPPVWVFPSMC